MNFLLPNLTNSLMLNFSVDAAKDAAKKTSNVEATFHVKKEVTTGK